MTSPEKAFIKLASLLDLHKLEQDDGGSVTEIRHAVLRQLDTVRTRFRSRAGRLFAAQQIEGQIAGFMHGVLAGASSPAELFRAVDALKARALLDEVASGMRMFSTPELAGQAAKQERGVLRYNPTYSDLALQQQDRMLASELPIANPELLTAVEELFETHNAGMVGGQDTYHLDIITDALQPDEVLIEYCLPRNAMGRVIASRALVVTADGMQLVELPELESDNQMRIAIDGQAPVDFFPLNNAAALLRGDIRNNRESQFARLRQLYDILVGPLIAAGISPQRFSHWTIVPDGALHHVPFAALRSPAGRFLGAETAISLVPSASVWFQLGRELPALQTFMGFANPVASGLPALPYAEAELWDVCRLMRNRNIACEAYAGRQVTKSRLADNVASKSIVHIATHGELANDQAMDFHELILSPSDRDDGRLSSYDVRHLDLRSTLLVALSVCDSGTYRFGPGNELHGLVPALLTAGARNVLATLWPIEDSMGRRFVVNFYKHLVQGGPAVALQRTYADLIAGGVDVRDWAAFVVIGPGRLRPPVPPLLRQ
jgi:CHAT domain-containing protein